MYTILSTVFANEGHTAAVIRTAEAGDVLISQVDTPAQWAALDGLAVAPYVEAVAVPQVVSKFQAKAALRGAGLLDQVEQMMADPAADPLTVLAWTEAQEFRRSSPTVAAMAQALGLDAAALDGLFITAAGIEA